MKKLFIRADGNHILGLGHLMRCMSIADAVTEVGGVCEFIVSEEEAEKTVTERGFVAHNLHTNWKDLSEELDLMISFIKEQEVPFLLVDSYYVPDNYFSEIRRYTKVAYLTGNNDKAYDIDVLIDYTVSSMDKGYEEVYKDFSTKLMTGVEYAPLRKQFEVPWKFREEVSGILLTTGGTDGEGIPVSIFEQMEREVPELLGCRWNVVVGKFYSERTRIQLEEYAKKYSVYLYENVTDMAKLMLESDLAISAGGSTLYELCACAVPTATFSFVDNQVRDVEVFGKKGYIFSAGDMRNNKELCIKAMLEQLKVWKENTTLREEQAKKMKAYIDGKGAKRLASELMENIDG